MYYSISYTLFYPLKIGIRKKKSPIAHFAIVAKDGFFWLSIVMSPQLICDVTRTRGTGIVTLYSPIVRARENWLKAEAKLIFTSE